MPSRELPPRPNLEQLKKQAKSLLDAAKGREPAALRRFVVLPSLGNRAPEAIDVADLALRDAQSVIARGHGFPSWNALREEVESRTLSFEAAVDEFVRCATAGATGRAERVLARHPRLSAATFHTALVLGDAATVCSRRRRWSGQSKGAAAPSARARITSTLPGCSSPQARRWTGSRPTGRRARNAPRKG